MPRTPPTIVAPLPRDPRVMVMAKKLNVSRADAYTAVADVWSMLAADAEGDIVKGWTLDMLDAVVEMEMAGCGAVMLQAGLVGVVDDGLVLPAELRHQQRDEHGGPAAAAAAGAAGSGEDERTLRRREQNRAAARRYRKTNRVTGSKAKPSGDKAWRSLGYVAGHEVRVFEGQYGPYAMVLGATVGGEPYKKLTTGDKSWSLESVRLVDTLPGLLEKWRAVHSKESGAFVPRPLAPTYADFRDDAERLTAVAKYQAAAEADAARHADAADASSRHADASASSAGPSADPQADTERKSFDGTGFDASSASADRHADALSSMSCLSKSSSSNEEDEMRDEGGQAAGDHERDQGDAEPEGMADWDQKKRRQRALAEKFSVVLGEDVESILRRWKGGAGRLLRLQLEQAGIDPNTGEPVNAEARGKPSRARADIGTTTNTMAGDKPAAGNVDARGDDERDHGNCAPLEFDCSHDDLRRGLQRQGIGSPAVKAPPAEDDAVVSGFAAGA